MTEHTRFTKDDRLRNAGQFTAVLRSAEINLSAGPLRLRAIRNRMPTARLGLVVTKKGNPLAVRRNRIKRQVREAFRLKRTQLPAVDIVIQVFSAIEDARLSSELDRLWQLLDKKHAALDSDRVNQNE